MLHIKLLIFLLFSFSFHCYSQQIENVDFTVSNNIINITYDLVNCPAKKIYDISIKFTDENRNVIYPMSITGDLKKVSSGKNKKIEWNVLNDKSELKGNVQAIVEISETYPSKVEEQPKYPDSFSPNGDGNNDILYAMNAGIKKLLEFKVFNRWGEVVFQTTDINVGWDGTYRGAELPTAVYVYLIKAITIEDVTEDYKGRVALIR